MISTCPPLYTYYILQLSVLLVIILHGKHTGHENNFVKKINQINLSFIFVQEQLYGPTSFEDLCNHVNQQSFSSLQYQIDKVDEATKFIHHYCHVMWLTCDEDLAGLMRCIIVYIQLVICLKHGQNLTKSIVEVLTIFLFLETHPTNKYWIFSCFVTKITQSHMTLMSYAIIRIQFWLGLGNSQGQ